ncbi:MAG: hypothetical protein ABJD97_03770 [Betaproteobacteria bacterium]
MLAKLVLQPAACAVLAYKVFALPPVWAATAVLLSALPTGTGPFMPAEFYGRDVAHHVRHDHAVARDGALCIALLQ